MANYTHPTRVTSTLHAEFSLNFALCLSLFFLHLFISSPGGRTLYISPVVAVVTALIYSLLDGLALIQASPGVLFCALRMLREIKKSSVRDEKLPPL
jgi:predicted branched-subunit amino acid permease